MATVNILGYETSSDGLHGDVEHAWKIIKDKKKGNYVVCLNPHSLVVAESDRLFSCSLSEANILLPDGVGIILASKILGKDIKSRVSGFDFFSGLSNKANQVSMVSYFFIGSTEDVLEKIKNRFNNEYSNIRISGIISPPFKKEFSEDENLNMIEKINLAKPDVLWVGMTAPKQEKWIYQNREKLDVPLIAAIGAVFDFYAGTKKRSPEWLCRLGLEWLPRFLREPVRLFKRNFISSPLFLFMVFKAKFGLGKGK